MRNALKANPLQRSDVIANMLTKAQSQYPFFGSYFYTNMDIVETKDVETAATDGKTLYFNPDFMATKTLDECVFIFCHEVLHAILSHFQRGKYYADLGTGPDGAEYSHKRANYAMDYIINAIAVRSKVGVMPQGALYDLSITDGESETWEEVYCKIPEPQDDGGSQGGGQGGGGNFDEHLEPEGEGMTEGEAQVAIEQAKQMAESMGELPAVLKRVLDILAEPQVNWQDELIMDMQARNGADDRTWRRPHRRRLVLHDQFLPSRTGVQCGGVAVVFDQSGSISDAELCYYRSELRSILNTCTPEWVDVLWCDTEVRHVDEQVSVDDIDSLDTHGGGGTDMGEGVRYAIEDLEETPSMVIVLTDGFTPWGIDQDDVPVTWLVTHKSMTAPHGKTIHVEVPANEQV